MVILTAQSHNEVTIRLTDERWLHIVEEHSELAGMIERVLAAIEQPEAVYEGAAGELLACKSTNGHKHLVVVYRESDVDGFVITAFLTSRLQYLTRRRRLWP